jgi:hypothetical protein
VGSRARRQCGVRECASARGRGCAGARVRGCGTPDAWGIE